MTTTAPALPTPARRAGSRRVVAALAGAAALFFVAVSGFAFYGELQKDDAGYLATDSHRFATDRSAIASEAMDFDAKVTDFDGYGKVRLQAESNAGEPVFVGIASAEDADEYLAGTDHARVSELDYMPFDADYDEHKAARGPAAPAAQDIWKASSQGDGKQTVTWDAEHGDWTVVVMNADGSPRVDADVSAGADVPVLDDVAAVSLALALGLGLASALLVVRMRRDAR